MVCNGILDDFQQFLLRVDRSNGQFMKQLDHETGETFKGSGNSNCGAHFDENTFGGVDVNLEATGLVDRRV